MRKLINRSHFYYVVNTMGSEQAVVVSTLDQLPILYKYKLSEYYLDFPIADEIDFIDFSLKECDIMTGKCEYFLKIEPQIGHLLPPEVQLKEKDLKFEIMLIQKWKDYILITQKNISQQLESSKRESKSLKKIDNNTASYSHRQIAIAYFIMGILITQDNAKDILKEHSKHTSTAKLIQKKISNKSELEKLSENKSTDTKHLKDLLAAERLTSGTKNRKAMQDISDIITTFQAKMEAYY